MSGPALWAQVDLSSTYSLNHRTYMEGMIGEDEKSFFALEAKYSGEVDMELFMRRFSKKDLNIDFVRNISPPTEKNLRKRPFEIDMREGVIHLFLIQTDVRNGRTTWGYHTVDNDAKLGPFVSVDTVQGFLIEPEDIKLTYKDGRYMAMTSIPKLTGGYDRVRLVTFEPSSGWRSTQEFELPHKVSNMEILELERTENELIVLVKMGRHLGSGEEGSNPDNVDFLLWKFFPDGRLEEVLLKVSGHQILGATCHVKGDEVVVSGMAGQGQEEGADAMISLVLDSLFRVVGTQLRPFEESEVQMFVQGSKKDDKLDHYKVRGSVSFEDGGAVMVCERAYDVVSQNHNNYTDITSYTTFHYFNSVLLAGMDSTGAYTWVKRIPKLQVSTNDEGYLSSFLYGVEGDSLSIWFNDSENNKELKNDQYGEFVPLNHYRKSHVAQVRVGSDGGITRGTAIPDDREERMLLRPSGSYIGKDGQVLLFLERGKSNRVARLRL